MEELHLLNSSLPSVRGKKEVKKKRERRLFQDSSGQREAAQVGTSLFSPIIRHPAEGDGEFWSLHMRLSFNLQPFPGKHLAPFLHFTQRAKVGDGHRKPSCDPTPDLAVPVRGTWSGVGAIAPPPCPLAAL